jgi:hypothetical protein
MELEIAKGQKTPIKGKAHVVRIKPTIEKPAKANVKRERFLAMLKTRYGYTNDKAVDELERLLTQFYRTNRSLDMHRAHPVYSHLHTE